MSDDLDETRGIQGVQGIQGIAGPQGVPGVAAPDAISRAESLTDALREYTKVLNKVLRRQWITWAVVALLIASNAVSGYLYFEVRDTQQNSCESGNNVRQGLLNIADVLEGSLSAPRPDGRPRTDAEVAQTEAFIAELRADFALRRCS